MITSSNYHSTVKNIDFKSAPEAIQNMHSKFDLMNKYYGKNDGITDALNVYMEKLNQWVNSSVKKPELKAKAESKEPKAKKTVKAIKTVSLKKVKLIVPKFKVGDLVKVRLKGWVMVIDKVEEYNKQSKGYRYFVENTKKGTGNGNVGSYWAHELKLYIPTDIKRKAVKKKVAPKKAVSKAVAPKPIKSSKVRTPELVLIRGFMALNKKSISIKSFETKLAASKHLETVNHKPLIDEIKSKLQAAISAAKADSGSNGRITATINPDFLKKCKETISNAKELLRVSYIGGVSKKKFVRKPSRVDDLLLLDEIKGRSIKKKVIKKKRKTAKK